MSKKTNRHWKIHCPLMSKMWHKIWDVRSQRYVYPLHCTQVDIEPTKLPPKRHTSNKNLDLWQQISVAMSTCCMLHRADAVNYAHANYTSSQTTSRWKGRLGCNFSTSSGEHRVIYWCEVAQNCTADIQLLTCKGDIITC